MNVQEQIEHIKENFKEGYYKKKPEYFEVDLNNLLAEVELMQDTIEWYISDNCDLT